MPQVLSLNSHSAKGAKEVKAALHCLTGTSQMMGIGHVAEPDLSMRLRN